MPPKISNVMSMNVMHMTSWMVVNMIMMRTGSNAGTLTGSLRVSKLPHTIDSREAGFTSDGWLHFRSVRYNSLHLRDCHNDANAKTALCDCHCGTCQYVSDKTTGQNGRSEWQVKMALTIWQLSL